MEWGGRATRAEISLDAIAHNTRALLGHIGRRELIAVVKANAYGHGATTVARAVLAAGAGMLATFAPAEAEALRADGIDAPILVLGPFTAAQATAYSRLHLTAAVSDLRAADRLAACAGEPIAVHLSVDTGLHREGVERENALNLARRISRDPGLRLEALFTHLAASEEPDHPANGSQLACLQSIVSSIRSEGIPVPKVHVANSGGALLRPDALFDGVRAGLAIYGYSPNAGAPPPLALRPALSLLSSISRVHDVSPGTGVGYGHAFVAQRATRVALVPIGYGDGLSRFLGNGAGSVLVAGACVPVVGRVSMDQITVDVTDIPDARVDSEVVMIGRSGGAVQDAHAVAKQQGTIAYEVLTSISGRVPRLYTEGGRLIGGR